ncbi:FtsX-like permease family protein [Duganella sp. Root336D2]|uniref:FtsX-like permease family protein n=1 Tax=Duganella sp. Root336D2 TaxID=1736518 RepID=UPI0006FB6E10|nr:ABC transporter permease [Duganella sp. Root336D2]KQV59333.1 multidrug ABC transporter substrate-binding protein [Duganella sp. Root336D2]
MRRLTRWLAVGEWRSHPVRALTAIAAIAIGVALGFAIHLVNAAALNEFTTAVHSLSGQADVLVSGTETTFDEAVYPVLARLPEVAVASPVLEFDASMPGARQALKIIGLDVFRAGFITPDLIGAPEQDLPYDTLADDAIFLSPAAMNWLQSRPGGELRLQAGSKVAVLRVAGSLQRARVGQRFAVMDIAAAQWQFQRLGKLSRVDLKLRDGVDRGAFERSLAARLEREFPGRFRVGQPDDAEQESRNANLSRAYRVNLSVLALVALFTGAFLVFSSQALSVLRRRSEFALLRVLGLERRHLIRQVLLEGALLGSIGSALGVAGGYALAAAVLRLFGGDLGAGYFAGVQPSVQWAPAAALAYFTLGLGVALLGGLAPAFDAARARPAVALKAGTDETALRPLSRPWPGLACLALAGAMTFAPPVLELPIFGYLSIALLLVGAIALMPRLSGMAFTALSRRKTANPVRAMALARLANASGQAGIALGGVLASFSLMVAMAIMVASFRTSVDDWVLRILPADVYARAASAGTTGGLSHAEQDALRAVPGVARIEFLRVRSVSLAPDRANVAILARDVDPDDPGRAMVLVDGSAHAGTVGASATLPPAWVSEAMSDLYGLQPGAKLRLPLQGRYREFRIAGIWRDYARAGGAVIVRRSDYIALTGDRDAGDAAIWLAKNTGAAQVQENIRKLPFGELVETSVPSEIRNLTLKIFDRSFAVTYLLEAIAIVIGLFGVAATFSAQTLARAREFGMLRHVGVTRGQVLGILALEGAALTTLGILAGFALGWVISLVLVHVINPQSFHWTMQMHYPWPLLATVALALLLSSAATALIAGRQALSDGPIRAVREDW